MTSAARPDRFSKDKEGDLQKEYMNYFLHLGEKGYAIWAEAIKTDVEKRMKE